MERLTKISFSLSTLDLHKRRVQKLERSKTYTAAVKWLSLEKFRL